MIDTALQVVAVLIRYGEISVAQPPASIDFGWCPVPPERPTTFTNRERLELLRAAGVIT